LVAPEVETGNFKKQQTGQEPMRFLKSLAVVFLMLTTPAMAQVWKTSEPEDTLVIETQTGKVFIHLRADLAPKHVERVKTLARQGFYNGQIFHRVIEGFMAQTGDPTGTGMGGSKLPDLPAEFSKEPFKRGSVGAARTSDPNSANSQFFICFNDRGCSSLNGQYTIWGEVIDGMINIDKVARGEPPEKPSKMLKVYVEADGPKGAKKGAKNAASKK
jgi:peptidylprolyl isomerase